MMSIELPPIKAVIFPGDTQWAIAAKVPAAALEQARRELSEFLQTDGSRIVTGNDGMSALLVFGGSLGEGEDLAGELSRSHRTPVYLLDFDDHGFSIQRFDGTRTRWEKGNPVEFLETYGITPPGFEPIKTTVVIVGVVEGTTLDRACKALPKAKHLFTSNSRGVLVKDVSGLVTLYLSRALKRSSYTLSYDRANGNFFCSIWESDQKPEMCFANGESHADCVMIDSILGETTLEGILRALDIPPEVLLLGPM
jgi:hypothetical protein